MLKNIRVPKSIVTYTSLIQLLELSFMESMSLEKPLLRLLIAVNKTHHATLI